MIQLFVLAAAFLTVLATEKALVRGDTPDEDMEKFIDECHEFVDVMNHCEEGWVAFEEEIVASVDSFVDRIVYTESLVVEEASQIVQMADKIVYTEGLMIELLESCDCQTGINTMNASVKALPPSHTTSAQTTAAAIGNKISLLLDPSLTDLSTEAAVGDTCSAMDMALEVMDACMLTFTNFNDDFLEVLSYLDYAIQDMGDRIVDTECMIMNMSVQIGIMADEVVEVEEITVDMLESCCLAGDVKRTRGKTGLNSRTTAENDDLLSHCAEFGGGKSRTASRKRYVAKSGLFAVPEDTTMSGRDIVAHVTNLLQEMFAKVKKDLSSDPIASVLRRENNKLYTAEEEDDEGGLAPCDTWWNPFCCAAEVCADMMAEMIVMMGDGMDAMTQMCKNCIDEVGKMADAIVDTEEDILVMGYAINDMADCIVVFIDQGLDFMSSFCPTFGIVQTVIRGQTSSSYFRGVQGKVEGETCSESANVKRLGLRMATRTRSGSVTASEQRKAYASKAAKAMDLVAKMKVARGNLVGTPFGDFAEMVNVCMEMMTTMATMFTVQMSLMNEIFKDITDMAVDEADLGAKVIKMGGDVSSMSSEVYQDEVLMLDVTNCMENK